MSRIFGVSSSTGLGIEGYLTCWKDELGNHTLGMKPQNMHQLRVLGAESSSVSPLASRNALLKRQISQDVLDTKTTLQIVFLGATVSALKISFHPPYQLFS